MSSVQSPHGELVGALYRDHRSWLLNWLRRQPLCHVDGGYCMVHAGLLPQWTAAEARNLFPTVPTVRENYNEFARAIAQAAMRLMLASK